MPLWREDFKNLSSVHIPLLYRIYSQLSKGRETPNIVNIMFSSSAPVQPYKKVEETGNMCFNMNNT